VQCSQFDTPRKNRPRVPDRIMRVPRYSRSNCTHSHGYFAQIPQDSRHPRFRVDPRRPDGALFGLSLSESCNSTVSLSQCVRSESVRRRQCAGCCCCCLLNTTHCSLRRLERTYPTFKHPNAERPPLHVQTHFSSRRQIFYHSR